MFRFAYFFLPFFPRRIYLRDIGAHNNRIHSRKRHSNRFFTINRAGVTSGTRKAFRIIPDGVAQYPDERIGASRWRMSIEKPKRSLGCSSAWLGPRSGMALETHPRDFGAKSSVGNSRSLPLIQKPSAPLRAPSSFLPFVATGRRRRGAEGAEDAYSFLSQTTPATRSKAIARKYRP